jgi:hypothetical protein
MSCYHAFAINPITDAVEVAEFLDDYFGHHQYGVKFPGIDKVFKLSDTCEVDNPTNPDIVKAAVGVLLWYHRDGSVGEAENVMESLSNAIGVPIKWLQAKR